MSLTLTDQEFSDLWNHIAMTNARLLELRTYNAGDALYRAEAEITDAMAILKRHIMNKKREEAAWRARA